MTVSGSSASGNDDLLSARQPGGVLAGVGGVEVGDIGAGVAGVHHSEYREQVQFLAHLVDIQFLALPQFSDILVTEAHLLGGGQDFGILSHPQSFFHVNDVLDGFQEEGYTWFTASG